MMKWLLTGVLALLFVPGALAAQESPYAGLEGRKIKALSEQQVKSYLAGEGMGFALAAELNGYPGPRHVLELADSLVLSEAQRRRTNEVFETMQATAQRLGVEIVASEAELDSLFLVRAITAESLQTALDRLGKLQGELRFAHLRAHLHMAEILTAEQMRRYSQLRGYQQEHDPGRHHPRN